MELRLDKFPAPSARPLCRTKPKPNQGSCERPPFENGERSRPACRPVRPAPDIFARATAVVFATRRVKLQPGRLRSRHLPLKIAQPFMAGFTVRNRHKFRQGRKKIICRPCGTQLPWRFNPALKGWAIFTALCSAVGASSVDKTLSGFLILFGITRRSSSLATPG